MFFVALSLLSCEVLPVGKHMLVRASSCWIMLFRLLIICSRCSLDSLDISRLRVGAHYYSPLDLKIKEAAFSSGFSGGTWRIRTAVPGFADRSLTARARYHFFKSAAKVLLFSDMTKYFVQKKQIICILVHFCYHPPTSPPAIQLISV